jgi:hypothetical protein
LTIVRDPGAVELAPGDDAEFTWQIPSTDGAPVAEIGVEIGSDQRADGTVYLDYLTWDGTPKTTLSASTYGGTMWQRAWVNGVDHLWTRETVRVSQDRGTGLLIQGTRQWADYEVEADIRPHLIRRGGLAARVQGMERYYALLFAHPNKLQLVRALDGDTVLAERDVDWAYDQSYRLRLRVEGETITAWVADEQLFHVTDGELTGGAVALVCDEGRLDATDITVSPIPADA